MVFFIVFCFLLGVGWGDFYIYLFGLGIIFFLLGGVLGGVCYMWIIGYFYEVYGFLFFFYVMFFYGIFLCILVFIMYFFIWGKGYCFKDEEKKEEVVEVSGI